MIITKIVFIIIVAFYEQAHCKTKVNLNVTKKAVLPSLKVSPHLLPIDKRDEVVAILFNYGDPKFEYPTVLKMSKACDLRQENAMELMMFDLRKIVHDHYKSEVIDKVAELMFTGPLIPDEDCLKSRGPKARNAKNGINEMNARRFDAKDYRDFLEKVMTLAIQPNTDITLPLLSCYLELWMNKTIEKYPKKMAIQSRVHHHTHVTFDGLIKYLNKDSKNPNQDSKGKWNCDFMNLPEGNVTTTGPQLRFRSIQMNLLEAIDNIVNDKLTSSKGPRTKWPDRLPENITVSNNLTVTVIT